jgi:hypothetical protein
MLTISQKLAAVITRSTPLDNPHGWTTHMGGQP